MCIVSLVEIKLYCLCVSPRYDLSSISFSNIFFGILQNIYLTCPITMSGKKTPHTTLCNWLIAYLPVILKLRDLLL